MKDRIRAILEMARINQATFAERVGIQQSAVSMWVSGKREPTEATKKLICSEFGISRHWLETGEGEMIDQQIGSDIELLTRSMEGQSEAKKKFLRIIAGMPDDLLDAVLAHLEKSLDTKNTP